MPSSDEIYKRLPKNEASGAVIDHLHFSEDKLVGPMRDKLMERYRSYRSYIKLKTPDSNQVRTRIAMPMIFSHIKSYSSRFIGNKPRIEVWERTTDENDRALAEKLRALIFAFWDQLSMIERSMLFFEYSMIMGTAVWKVGWRREVKDIEVIREMPTLDDGLVSRALSSLPDSISNRLQKFERRPTKEETTVHDDPTLDLKELDTVYPHPSAPNWYDSPWIVERQRVAISTLRDAQGPDGNKLYDPGVVSQLVELSKSGNPEFTLPDWAGWALPLAEQKRQEFGPETGSEPDPWQRNVHLVTQWTDGKEVAAILERPDLPPIRDEANRVGIKPFCVYSPNPLPNELMGLSTYEILNSLWRYTNALYAAQLDHALSAAHQMWTVERLSSVNPAELRRRPDGIIWVDDHSDVAPVDTPRQDFALPRLSEDIRRWGEQAMGSPNEFVGRPSKGARTATEVASLGQAAGFRALQFFTLFNEGPMKRLGQLLIRYAESYMSTEKMARIIGDELAPSAPVKISPADLRSSNPANFDILIDVASTDPETRGFRLQEAVNALSILSNIEPPESPVMQRFKILLLQGLGVDRPQQLVEQSAQMIQQLRQQAQQQAAGTQSREGGQTSLAEDLSAEAGQNSPGTFMRLPQ